jgi:hypothetical protein
MNNIQRIARGLSIAAATVALGACSQVGNLGGVLGSVLQPQAAQLAGTVQSVDTRNQQIAIQQSNGQNLAVTYDSRTKVVYQNQTFAVTSLEFGDQVVARVQDQGNNVYYTDSVYVTQPVNNSNTTTNPSNTANVQSLQGTVRSIDRTNGAFTMDAGNNYNLTVTLPYRASSTDLNKFQNLRVGEYVRIYGIFLNSSRVELQRFY